jgi:imidazolonepropionase-like amidohydrolase
MNDQSAARIPKRRAPSLVAFVIAFVVPFVVPSVVALALLVTAPVARAVDAPSAPGFVVHGARVFDGRRVLDGADVMVRDGRIVAVGAGLAVPAGFTVVDGRGRTLLPGLIDAHTHSFLTARRDAIRFGVTTELDMFSDWHQIAEARKTRESTAPTPVADLWSAGTLATVPHGHGTEYGFPIPTLTRPDEADAFVKARMAEGSDYLKIILEDGSAYGHPLPTLDLATTKALVASAHAQHKLAVAHVATEEEAREAFDAHIDGLAHVFIDRTASPATIALAQRSGAFVVATLSVAASASGSDDSRKLADDPRIAPWLAVGQATSLRAPFPDTWRKSHFLPDATENVRRLHAAGVPILAGTDSGNPGTAHGASLHEEMALLVSAGLSPVEALAAATAEPAQRFGLVDRGRIAAGLRADLVLVDGDPTTDIESTRAIVAIWKNGVAIDRALEPSEKPGATGAAASADTVVSDFEDGAIAVRYGQNWSVTSDALIGGKSTATQTWQAGGANGSKGAMRVSGTIDGAMPFAWAGSLYAPGTPAFEAVDFSKRKTLVFKVRGDVRELTAMLFSGPATQRMPATVRFAVSAEWTEVRIPLDRFEGGDPSRTRAIAVTAGPPAGPFDFQIDDVRIE